MPQKPTVLVTGGAGYIGSHTCVELLQAGYGVVVLDNLSNASACALDRVRDLTQRPIEWVKADVRDRRTVSETLERFNCEAVLHFAGLKAVGESVEKPLHYYQNNVEGAMTLLDAMANAGVFKLVFSSSATVYGEPQQLPLREDHPRSATNPYGRSKLMIEEILEDLGRSDPRWAFAILRYFNPVGAHESGRIGEDPKGIPNNLMPFITQVATGKRPLLRVFGQDYPTPDGTGMRDYIHVVDLAIGHVQALDRLAAHDSFTVNLGTGTPYSVLEVLAAFEKTLGRTLPHEFMPRRPGDVACCYADPTHARTLLGFEAVRDLDAMCRDAWNWQSNNPDGYPD